MSYKDDILRLRELGHSYKEISDALGCAKSTVSYYCSPNTRRNTLKNKRKSRNTPKKTQLKGECLECGGEISSKRIYCSNSCASLNKEKRKLNVRSTGSKKTCSICRKVKDLSRFGFDRNTRDGYMRQCSSCNTSRVSTYISENEIKYKPNYERHGMTYESYTLHLTAQNGKCFICRKEFNDDIFPCIDHDHTCCLGLYSCGNCVRGILCTPCNQALGLLRDSLDSAQNLVIYLEKKISMEK